MANIYTPNNMVPLINVDETVSPRSTLSSYQLVQKARLVDIVAGCEDEGGGTYSYKIHENESGSIFHNLNAVNGSTYVYDLPPCREGIIFTFWNRGCESTAVSTIYPQWSNGDTITCPQANFMLMKAQSGVGDTTVGTNSLITLVGTKNKVWRELYRPMPQDGFFYRGFYAYWWGKWGKEAWDSATAWTTFCRDYNLFVPRAQTGAWYYYMPGVEHGRITKTSNYTILASENGAIFDNSGAAGTVEFTLPSASPGLHYSFDTTAAQKIIIRANTDDYIQSQHTTRSAQDQTSINNQRGGSVAACPGYHIWLMAVDDTNWMQWGSQWVWGRGDSAGT